MIFLNSLIIFLIKLKYRIKQQYDYRFCLIASPTIVVSPPPKVEVEPTYTITINCTAMGIPTPEIIWRLNWGCVPEKCTMTSTQQVKSIFFKLVIIHYEIAMMSSKM